MIISLDTIPSLLGITFKTVEVRTDSYPIALVTYYDAYKDVITASRLDLQKQVFIDALGRLDPDLLTESIEAIVEMYSKEWHAKRISEQATSVLEALMVIREIISFEDLVYDVRERELKGWDGPKVVAYSDACMKMNKAMEAIRCLTPNTSST
jgi:hypothetical protein